MPLVRCAARPRSPGPTRYVPALTCRHSTLRSPLVPTELCTSSCNQIIRSYFVLLPVAAMEGQSAATRAAQPQPANPHAAGAAPPTSTGHASTDAFLQATCIAWGHLQPAECKAVRASCSGGLRLHDRLLTHLQLTLGATRQEPAVASNLRCGAVAPSCGRWRCASRTTVMAAGRRSCEYGCAAWQRCLDAAVYCCLVLGAAYQSPKKA